MVPGTLDCIVLRGQTHCLLGEVAALDPFIFRSIFWHRLGIPFYRILVPTWLQLASQLGPKIHQKSTQEASKTQPNIHLVIDLFFHWFLMNCSLIFDPQINENLIKNLSTNDPNNTTTKWCRCPKNVQKPTVFYYFCYVGHVILAVKINKNWWKSIKQIIHFCIQFKKQLGPNLAPFWEGFGGQVGAKIIKTSILTCIQKLIDFFSS